MPKHSGHLNDLLHAVRQNNIDSIKHLMAPKPKAKEKSSFSFGCLVNSHELSDKESLQKIIMEATLLNDPTILSYLIKHGANINFCTKFVLGGTTDSKSTPLHVAVERRSHDTMEVLIGANADVNHMDSRGKSALHYACQNCDVIATRLLLCSGANAHLVDRKGTTPLQVASRFGHVDLVRVLLEHNAQIFQEKQRGESPLHIAAQEGHVPLLDMFGRLVDIDIQAGCGVNQLQCSSIHLACGKGLIETVRFVVERFGTNINILDSEGNSPLHHIVKAKYNFKTMRHKDNFSVVTDYLIKKKVSINTQNRHGDTALHLAAQNGFHKSAESLLMSGADPLIQNEAGLTSRDLIPAYDAEMKQTFLRCAPFSNAYITLATVVNDNRGSGSQGQRDKSAQKNRENLLNIDSNKQEVQVYKTVVQTSYDM